MALSVVFVLYLLALPVGAQLAPAQLQEDPDRAVPLGIIKNNDGGTHHWGATRVIQVPERGRVHAFTTGVDLTQSACNRRDQVWLFQNPNNRPGWLSEYTLAAPIRVLPKPDNQCTGCTGLDCAGCASWMDFIANDANPFKVGSDYFLIVSLSPPNAACIQGNHFFQLIMGHSTDGVTWTWRPFLKTADVQSVGNISWKPFTVEGQDYLWGYLGGRRFDLPGVQRGIGGIRLKRASAPCSDAPWCLDGATLEMYSGGRWRALPRCEYPPGTPIENQYEFCAFEHAGNPERTAITFDHQGSQGTFPSLHHLWRFGPNVYELWSHGSGPQQNCGCYQLGVSGANRLLYRQFTAPTSLAQTPFQLLGPVMTLGQDSVSPVRCQPGGMTQSRVAPFRLDFAKDILYSRSRNNQTDPFQCPGTEHYVVRTFLEEQ